MTKEGDFEAAENNISAFALGFYFNPPPPPYIGIVVKGMG